MIDGPLAKYAHQGAEITLICTTVGDEVASVDSIEVTEIYEKELMSARAILGLHYIPCIFSVTQTAACSLQMLNGDFESDKRNASYSPMCGNHSQTI